jgi:hypothetical protein
MSAYQSADPTTQHTRHLFVLLLSPSWLSSILGAFTGMCIIAFVLLQGRLEGTSLQQQYLSWQADDTSLNTATSSVRGDFADGIGTLQVFIFWCAIGAILYLIVSSLYLGGRALKEARQQRQFCNYSRTNTLKRLYMLLAIRSAALVLWGIYLLATVTFILPYAIGAIHVADEHLPTIGAFVLLIVAFIGLMAAYHLHVLLLRLLLWRPRAFHAESYVELSSKH